MDIQLVLEVSAIATVISAIISYLTFRRSSNLTYVTHERKEWREAIRKIAEDLEKTPYENRDNVLVKLKTRINAYGYDGKDEVKDAHIWKLIERMEKCEEAEDYIPLKKRMAFYLSALLKYDWERSKKEVYGNVLQFIGRIFAVVAFALFFIALVQQYKENLFEVLPDILIVLFLLIWAVIVVSLCWKWIELSKELNTSKAYIKFGICSAILLGAFAKIAFTIQENNENEYILAFLIVFLLFIGVQLLVELQKMQENIYYREFIRKYDQKKCKDKRKINLKIKKILLIAVCLIPIVVLVFLIPRELYTEEHRLDILSLYISALSLSVAVFIAVLIYLKQRSDMNDEQEHRQNVALKSMRYAIEDGIQWILKTKEPKIPGASSTIKATMNQYQAELVDTLSDEEYNDMVRIVEGIDASIHAYKNPDLDDGNTPDYCSIIFRPWINLIRESEYGAFLERAVDYKELLSESVIHLLNVLGDNYSFKDCKVIYDAHKNKLFEQDEGRIKIYDNGELVFDGMLNRNDKR